MIKNWNWTSNLVYIDKRQETDNVCLKEKFTYVPFSLFSNSGKIIRF